MPDSSPHPELDDVLAVHYQTGDYVPLGIWAQDNVPVLLAQLEAVELRFDALRYLAVELTKKPFGQLNQRAFYALREAVSNPAYFERNPDA